MSHKKSLILRKNKYWDYKKKLEFTTELVDSSFFCFQMGIAQNLSDIVSFRNKNLAAWLLAIAMYKRRLLSMKTLTQILKLVGKALVELIIWLAGKLEGGK